MYYLLIPYRFEDNAVFSEFCTLKISLLNLLKLCQYFVSRDLASERSRVAQQRDEAVGLGSRDVFYYGAPALKPRGQSAAAGDRGRGCKSRVHAIIS